MGVGISNERRNQAFHGRFLMSHQTGAGVERTHQSDPYDIDEMPVTLATEGMQCHCGGLEFVSHHRQETADLDEPH